MAHALNTPLFSFNPAGRIREAIAGVKAARARRAAFERAYAELQMLSDRELVEFGLHRSDLIDLARAEADKR